MNETSGGELPPSNPERGRANRRNRGRPGGRGGRPGRAPPGQSGLPAIEALPVGSTSSETAPPSRRGGRGALPRHRSRARTPALHSRPMEVPPPDPDQPLAIRLAYELATETHECCICFATIAHRDAIWSCTQCFAVLHLKCVSDWATQNVADAGERAQLLATREGPNSALAEAARAEVAWRCPACRATFAAKQVPKEYRCFCGQQRDPAPPASACPHSCAATCRRRRPFGCEHSCGAACHPGPCEPCSSVLHPQCHCGRETLAIRCSQLHPSDQRAAEEARYDLLSCQTACGKLLSCGAHYCSAPCHAGSCAACRQVRKKRCYCGHQTAEEMCSVNDKRATCVDTEGSEEWTGEFSCDRPCQWRHACGIHRCEEGCHAHTSTEPTICPRDPSIVTHCPCGSSSLRQKRTLCTDPIPRCGQMCGKMQLSCSHVCQSLCHEGSCPPCTELVVAICRCGLDKKSLPCALAAREAEKGERLCDQVCQAMRHCGRHICRRRCCPLAYQTSTVSNKKGKGKRATLQSALDIEAEDPLGLHQCDIMCGKILDCKIHHCERPDHRGPCGKCLNASFDELRCHCGMTVMEPPVPCAATVQCSLPCRRPPPPCGHAKTPHACHPDTESCPPCPFLVTKICPCPRQHSVRNVKCSVEKVSCGMPCGRPLSCGWHKCKKLCHPFGECQPCAQTCGKPKKLCGHPCPLPCHAPAACDLDTPCTATVDATCPCGNLKKRVTCGMCTSHPEGNASSLLKCNDSCALVQRNAILADALCIDPSARPGSANVQWPADVIALYAQNPVWSKGIEDTLVKLVENARQMGGKGSHLFPPMRWAQRRLVHEVAERFGLESESLDAEPNRSVFTRFKQRSAVPTPLISTAFAEQLNNKAPTVMPTRKPTKQSANALLLHGFNTDSAYTQARITSHLATLHEGLLLPAPTEGAVLLTLSPPPSSIAALEQLRTTLAFDSMLGCTFVELVCLDVSSQNVLWRESGGSGDKSTDTTPMPSRPLTPTLTPTVKQNAFATLDSKGLNSSPSPAGAPAADEAVTPEDWEDAVEGPPL